MRQCSPSAQSVLSRQGIWSLEPDRRGFVVLSKVGRPIGAPGDCPLIYRTTGSNGCSRTVTVLKCGRSAAVFQNRQQLSGNGGFHRTPHFSANSANMSPIA